jgi:hypothetical protein
MSLIPYAHDAREVVLSVAEFLAFDVHAADRLADAVVMLWWSTIPTQDSCPSVM